MGSRKDSKKRVADGKDKVAAGKLKAAKKSPRSPSSVEVLTAEGQAVKKKANQQVSAEHPAAKKPATGKPAGKSVTPKPASKKEAAKKLAAKKPAAEEAYYTARHLLEALRHLDDQFLDMPLVLIHGKSLQKPNLVQGLIPAPTPVRRSAVDSKKTSLLTLGILTGGDHG